MQVKISLCKDLDGNDVLSVRCLVNPRTHTDYPAPGACEPVGPCWFKPTKNKVENITSIRLSLISAKNSTETGASHLSFRKQSHSLYILFPNFPTRLRTSTKQAFAGGDERSKAWRISHLLHLIQSAMEFHTMNVHLVTWFRRVRFVFGEQ